jgi:hypothetical protein
MTPLKGDFEMTDYKNVRIAVVDRVGEKDWAGTGRYLSIRAYSGHGDRVYMGPDIPISSGLSNDQVERLTKAFLVAVCGEETLEVEEDRVRLELTQ